MLYLIYISMHLAYVPIIEFQFLYYVSWFATFLLPSLLIQYIQNSVLPNMRVSAQSLGLACITAAVDISLPILPTLEPLEMFAFADDPKLRCRFVKVCISSEYCHRAFFVKVLDHDEGGLANIIINL